MKMRGIYIVLLALWSFQDSQAQSTYTCMNSEIDTIRYTELSTFTQPDTTTIIRSISLADAMAPNQDPTCGNRLQKVKMIIKIDVGEDYIYGNIPWALSYNLKVKVKQTGNVLFDDSHTFDISQYQPEELWVVDYPNICFFYFSDEIEFEVTSLSSAGMTTDIEDDFRMQVYYEFEEKFDVDDVTIVLDPIGSGLITDNPVTFSWTPSCECTPNYEFQLLKLENRSGDPYIFTTKIDWYSALTIETQSSDPTITLTLVEGSGYYYWRVRPIGDYYDGGYGNSRNYGEWSNAGYWNSLTNTEYYLPPHLLSTDYALNYQQFDDTLNWIYSRQFSEAERTLEGKIKMSEEMTYANGLQQVRQHQRHLFSQGNIVANHTGIDYSGRPALSTIYAPVTNQDHLGYVSDMAVASGGGRFDASNFDENINFKDPEAIANGKIIDYYDNGLDLTIPSSEGHPYTRTLFYGDGMNRVRESSGVGKPLRIQSDDSLSHTTRYYYSGVADQELIRVFGDEAPNANSVIKMITVDPNKTTTVSYQTKEGQTIATCLSASKNEAYHDTLISRQAFTIKDTISGDISCGDGCLTSSKTLGFGEPTTVNFNYSIAPSTVDAFCELACTTCEYQIIFFMKRVDDPFDPVYPKADTLTLPPDLCTNNTLQTWATSHTFDPGTYLVERRIQIGNTAPSTINPPTSPFGYSYLQTQLFDLDQSIQNTVESDLLWDTITSLLDSAEIDLLYTYLEQNHNLQPTDTVFTFNTSCCSFDLPIIRCEDCPIMNRKYEEYYDSINGSSVFDQLPSGYGTGQFNGMLEEMIDNHGYSEQAICDCWTGITQSWESIANETYSVDGNSTSSDLLRTFLTCTGYQFANLPFATSAHEPYSGTTVGYLSHAFSHFEYDINNPSDCETLYCVQGIIGSDNLLVECNPDSTINWPLIDFNNSWSNEHWLEFYSCTQSGADIPFTGEIGETFTEFLEEIQDSCLSACENRYQSYVAALEYYYETELGVVVVNNPLISDTCSSCILYDTLYCQANKLVKHCESFCENVESTTFFEDFNKAMYYAFELEVPSSGMCKPKWDHVGVPNNNQNPNGTSIVDQNRLLLFLNSLYNSFVDFQPIDPVFPFLRILEFLRPGLSDSCRFETVPLVKGGYFTFTDDCQLRFLTDPYDRDLDMILCRSFCPPPDTISCPSICIRYFPIEIDSVDHIFEPITCAEQTADFTNGLLQSQLLECQESSVSQYEDLYTNTCLDPANIMDTFALEYELGYYHYTLYYYDRANNLVQTVAPAGVHETTTSRMQNTTHDYKTQYRHNTLQQLIWQYSPDGGTTEFIYDSKGQLRFSQNAQQKIDGTCAYTKYDYLGRIIEVGKYTFSSISWIDLNDPLYFDDPDFPQVNDPQLSERVLTIYSDPYPYPLSGGTTQTYLQNRVSYTHTDKDGDLTTETDQITTFYSYDVHGNVNTLIQDIMPDIPSPREIRQFRIDYDYDLISNKVVQMNYMEGRADQFFHRYRYDEDNRITQVETSRNKFLWDRDARYTYYDHGPLKRTLLGEDQIQGIDYTYTIQGWLKSINHPTLNENMDPGEDGLGSSVVPKDVFASALTYFDNDFVKQGSYFDDTPYGGATSQSPYHDNLNPIRNLYNGNITQWTSNSYVDQVANPDFVHPGWTGRQFRYDELNRLVDSDFSFHNNTWYATDEYDSNYSYDANGNILSLNRDAYIETGSSKMDSLAYNYNDITLLDPSNYPLDNQLDSIVDLAYGPTSLSPYDVDLEQRYWYEYDAIGNLVKDTSSTEPKLDISWNLMGKVDRIEKEDGATLGLVYDAIGNRVQNANLNNVGEMEFSYYVKDLVGNIISTYRVERDVNENYLLHQKEAHLYGNSRIGIENKIVLSFVSDNLGNTILENYNGISKRNLNTSFEMNDHLNNVRVLISNLKKFDGSNFTCNISDVKNYFPNGFYQESRSIQNSDYIFGQNGEENILPNNINLNLVDYGDRIYLPKVGRWGSSDPNYFLYSNEGSYNFSGNNVNLFIDKNGRDYAIYINHVKKTVIVKATLYVPMGKSNDISSATMGADFWNNQSNKFSYKVRNNEGVKEAYEIVFDIKVKEETDPMLQMIIDKSNFETLTKKTFDGSSNTFAIVPNQSLDEGVKEGYTRNGTTAHGRNIKVTEENKYKQTGAHEIGHALGLKHKDGTIMSKDPNSNRSTSITNKQVKRLIRRAKFPKLFQGRKRAKGKFIKRRKRKMKRPKF